MPENFHEDNQFSFFYIDMNCPLDRLDDIRWWRVQDKERDERRTKDSTPEILYDITLVSTRRISLPSWTLGRETGMTLIME